MTTEALSITKNNLAPKVSMGTLLTKYGLAIVTILIAIVFGLAEPSFASFKNFMDILSSASIMGITGIGVTIIMCSGEIDFACGLELTVGAIVVGKILDSNVFNSYIGAVAISIGIMVVFGLFNAFLHVKIGIPAFIATMGSSLFAQGIAKWMTKSSVLYSSKWPENFTFLGQGYLFKIIPIPVVVLIIVSAIMWFYAEMTKNGKFLYAVGSNATACKYVGIDTRKQKLKGFVICAVLCGLAGIMQGSMLNRVTPYMGDTILVNALTALMLGATFLRPGVFNIPGTLLGALLVIILGNGFTMIGAPAYAKELMQGAIMLFAVSTVSIIRRKTERTE